MTYLDIMVPCFPVPIKMPTPDLPSIPTTFMAHTLFAPNPEDHDNNSTDSTASWFKRLLRPMRRSAAQPSRRYLNLLTTGAKEHNFPQAWQDYLGSLMPYTPTSCRQRLGAVLFQILFLPFVLVIVVLVPMLAKLWRRMTGGGPDDGKLPRWMTVGPLVMQNLVWMLYDTWAKHVFGDGEKTEEKVPDNEADQSGHCWSKCGRSTAAALPEEKQGLLDD